jgi:hypothetical protein
MNDRPTFLSFDPRRLVLRLRNAVRDERGDVPGWVMITVMTVVVAAAILAIFQPWVEDFLSETLNDVR